MVRRADNAIQNYFYHFKLFNFAKRNIFLGNIMCKLTAYITNVTSCYSNWLWVMMFAQRFAHIFFPMHRVKADEGGKLLRILDDTRILILITGLMSAGSQVIIYKTTLMLL